MEPLTKLNEDFLSCNICTEIYKDPCTLGCDHTFCRGCLTKYTKTRRNAITAKAILCPNCCQMTKVPRPQEPVDQWCNQFKPNCFIQGLLDTFKPKGIDPVKQCCFTCEKIGNITHANSVCEDCDIKLCESCAKVHIATPMAAGHVISPLGATSTSELKKRRVMCKKHNWLVEFCCKNCQKAICLKCCMVYHRDCQTVTIDSMIPEMKEVLLQNFEVINSKIEQTGTTLIGRRSQMEDIRQHKNFLQSEIRRVSQEGVDLIRRKEKKLLDELDLIIEKQTGELKGQIKSGENDIQTYQQHSDFINQVLQFNSPMELYDMYTLCQSGRMIAEIESKDKQGKQGDRTKRIEFENQLDVDEVDRTLHLGHWKLIEVNTNLKDTTVLLSTVSTKSTADKIAPDPYDIEVLNIDGTETVVVTDFKNSSVKSCYRKGGKPHCKAMKLTEHPQTLTKIGRDSVAVSHWSHNGIKLIKLTPDPVLIASIKTKKNYRCLTALSDTTLAAGCDDPPSIDVLDLSGRVLRSVITPSTGQQLIQYPRYMCTTGQGHIMVADEGLSYVFCVTQQGQLVQKHQLTGRYGERGVTTTDTGSVIVADLLGDKIVQLTETGRYVRDLLTKRDGIDCPRGICVYGNKLYVTELESEQVKIFHRVVSTES